MSNSKFKVGDFISFEKEIMFKGIVTQTSKIVAITSRYVLLESKDKFFNINF